MPVDALLHREFRHFINRLTSAVGSAVPQVAPESHGGGVGRNNLARSTSILSGRNAAVDLLQQHYVLLETVNSYCKAAPNYGP